MRESRAKKAGKQNLQFVRDREVFTRRKRVLDSPLGGLQILAAHLNQLPGLRAELDQPGCPAHFKDEVAAWERVEDIITHSPAQAVDLFNEQAKHLPMLLQVEWALEEPAPFIASLKKSGDQHGEALRHLWWYYFRGKGWTRIRRCPVCFSWFVDTSKNRVTVRCSSACTAKWWSRDRRKNANHNLTPAKKGTKHHGTKRR